MVCFDLGVRIERQSTLPGDVRFRLADVLLVEQKLTIQVAHVDRIQIDLPKKEPSVCVC